MPFRYTPIWVFASMCCSIRSGFPLIHAFLMSSIAASSPVSRTRAEVVAVAVFIRRHDRVSIDRHLLYHDAGRVYVREAVVCKRRVVIVAEIGAETPEPKEERTEERRIIVIVVSIVVAGRMVMVVAPGLVPI